MGGLPNSLCLVDSDAGFAEFLSQYLRARGAEVRVHTCAEDCLASEEAYGGYVIDPDLPGMDGIDLLSLLRATHDDPVLVLSRRPGADAFTAALSAGADMFIPKPVRGEQIVQALIAVTRRGAGGHARQPCSTAAWTFDAAQGVLVAPDGPRIELSPIEKRLLAKLSEVPGRSVTRDALAEAASLSATANHRNLDAAMFRLRRKIETRTGIPAPVVTAHGVGYCLMGETGLAS